MGYVEKVRRKKMNGYIAILHGKRVEIYAESLYAARVQAEKILKPRKCDKGYLVVMFAEKQGEPVVHSTAAI